MTKAFGLALQLIRFEVSLYKSLTLWILRRPDVPPGTIPVPYVGGVSALLWAFICVSAVELVAFHLILPWETVRLIVDIASVWGLVWMLGYAASLHVYPHLITTEGLRVRHGSPTDVLVPWSSIAAISSKERGRERSKAVQYDDAGGRAGGVLNVVIGSLTNVDLTLAQPVLVHAGGVEREVGTVRFRVDDPHTLLTQAREAHTVRGSAATS